MSVTYWCTLLGVVLVALFLARKSGAVSRRIIVGLWMLYLLRIAIPVKIPTRISVYNWIDPLLNRHDRPIRQMTAFRSNGAFVSVPKFASLFYDYYALGQIVGILISAVCVAVLILRCRAILKRTSPIQNQMLDDWIKENHADFYKRIRVRTSATFTTVMTCDGLSKPYLLLPPDFVFDEAAPRILEHEIAHLRRHDSLVKPLALFITLVNWFNPFAWIGFFFLCRDMEIACDEAVLSKNDRDFRRKYANTLLDCVPETLPNKLFNSYRSSKNLRERIVCIMKYKPKPKWRECASFVLSGVVFLSLSTNLIALKISDGYCAAVPKEVVDALALQEDPDSHPEPKISYRSARADGTIAPHLIDLAGDRFVYDQAGAPWVLSANQTVKIRIRMLDRRFRYGQGIEIGYLLNGGKAQIVSDQIHAGIDLDFSAPTSGEYLFYVECASSDPLDILELSIAAEPAQHKENASVTATERSAMPSMIDLSRCERVEVDAKGNARPQSGQSLSAHTIRGGSTMYYYESGTTGWQIDRGQTMSLSATLRDSGLSWSCGYEGGGYAEAMAQGASTGIYGAKACPADGSYKFYIRNHSAEPITIESGAVDYQ